MLTRRALLLRSLKSSALVPLASAVPLFLPRSLAAGGLDASGERILVVIELAGGNDGINTVVPYADEGYSRHRRELRLPVDRLIKLNDHLGFHPALRAMTDLWEKGSLVVVQGVGYPNPNRSHFQSMDIWQSARLDARERTGLGWIGRGLDTMPEQSSGAAAMSVGPQAMPVALCGRKARASSIYRSEQFELSEPIQALDASHSRSFLPDDDLHGFACRTASTTARTIEQLGEIGKTDPAAENYPPTALAERLRLTARLIRADLGIHAFYAQQTGYDTHAGQLPRHEGSLGELSEAVAAFFSDLSSAGLAKRVVVLAFSEFGRRVQENLSHGTDHGTSGPVFLAGPAVGGGIAGSTPSLLDLQDGDLKMAVDFRSVYATILQQWLSVPSEEAVGGRFPLLPLFKR